MGISEATFYNWKKMFGGLGPSEVRRLKQLEEENRRLKQMVADLSLDKQMLEDLLVVMAKTDVDPDVRVIAIGKVRDPIALSKILNDAEVKLDIRLVALKRIDDQCVIEEVAKNNDLDFSMREAAIEKLTKQDALFHLSKNDEDEDIRVAAVERLQDKKLLQDIANSDYHLLVRAAASDMLSKNIQRFLAEAVDGPSTCIIPIWQFNYLYFALTARLKKKGLTNSKIVDLVDEKLLGVCPDCATPSGGQGLSLKATYDRFGGVMLTGNTGGMEHLMEGTCRNQDCHSKTIIIFWRPDEDLGAVKRLAEMGIHVKHK
jgi:hypothetical protein